MALLKGTGGAQFRERKGDAAATSAMFTEKEKRKKERQTQPTEEEKKSLDCIAQNSAPRLTIILKNSDHGNQTPKGKKQSRKEMRRWIRRRRTGEGNLSHQTEMQILKRQRDDRRRSGKEARPATSLCVRLSRAEKPIP